jgi:hypothetical protein
MTAATRKLGNDIDGFRRVVCFQVILRQAADDCLKLTRFRGHLILTEEGVRHANQ